MAQYAGWVRLAHANLATLIWVRQGSLHRSARQKAPFYPKAFVIRRFAEPSFSARRREPTPGTGVLPGSGESPALGETCSPALELDEVCEGRSEAHTSILTRTRCGGILNSLCKHPC